MDLEIPYYEIPPNYEEFFKKHLIPNLPAVIGPKLIEQWECRKKWIVPTNDKGNGPKYKPNYSYLRDHFGTAKGQVARCNKRHFTDQERESMSFKDFVDLWEADDGKESLYYLKDCHLANTFPNDEFYTLPDIFQDDWLNEYWNQNSNDDYKFSYMGGDTTFTPLHADVYRSYSWSSNICGIKKWTFFPPNQEDLFKDKYGNMVYDIRRVCKEDFPKFSQAQSIVLYQKDGETVFVPSGWFHQVENIGAAISINHNWANACNLKHTFRSLKKDLDDCTKAIDDVKDSMTKLEFIQECQNLLLVHSGWDWKTFLNMLHCIVKNRSISLVHQNQPPIKWQMEQINTILNEWIDEQGDNLLEFLHHHSNDKLNLKYIELKEYINKLI